MTDPSTITTAPITGLSAAYLVRCWRDGCQTTVDPDDALGLCRPHLGELRSL